MLVPSRLVTGFQVPPVVHLACCFWEKTLLQLPAWHLQGSKGAEGGRSACVMMKQVAGQGVHSRCENVEEMVTKNLEDKVPPAWREGPHPPSLKVEWCLCWHWSNKSSWMMVLLSSCRASGSLFGIMPEAWRSVVAAFWSLWTCWMHPNFQTGCHEAYQNLVCSFYEPCRNNYHAHCMHLQRIYEFFWQSRLLFQMRVLHQSNRLPRQLSTMNHRGHLTAPIVMVSFEALPGASCCISTSSCLCNDGYHHCHMSIDRSARNCDVLRCDVELVLPVSKSMGFGIPSAAFH